MPPPQGLKTGVRDDVGDWFDDLRQRVGVVRFLSGADARLWSR